MHSMTSTDLKTEHGNHLVSDDYIVLCSNGLQYYIQVFHSIIRYYIAMKQPPSLGVRLGMFEIPSPEVQRPQSFGSG